MCQWTPLLFVDERAGEYAEAGGWFFQAQGGVGGLALGGALAQGKQAGVVAVLQVGLDGFLVVLSQSRMLAGEAGPQVFQFAQLAGEEHGRQRWLSCGCCGTRWQFKRTCCPFCESDSQRLESVVIEGESGLRIDHCASCGGYIKTYDGVGYESLLLSDWSSLHLDVLAADRGLKRLAASLYEFEPAPDR